MKKIVITGFSGVLSRAILCYISENYVDVEVVGIARNHNVEMCSNKLNITRYSFDLSKCEKYSNTFSYNALCLAIKNADILIHTAAIKRVTDCEQLPLQAIQTNILGTQNVIDASVESGVKQIVNISSDMSVEPIGVYGATKLLQSKLIIDAFNSGLISACNIRLGNIFTKAGGTILHFFNSKYQQTGVLPVTDLEMSRFGEVDSRVVELIFELSGKSLGGEIFVPKFKSYDIITVVAAISKNARIEVVGMRQGEKLFEIMISRNESQNVIESDNYYVIVPSNGLKNIYKSHHKAQDVATDFSLTSENNLCRYNKDDLHRVMEQIGVAIL